LGCKKIRSHIQPENRWFKHNQPGIPFETKTFADADNVKMIVS